MLDRRTVWDPSQQRKRVLILTTRLGGGHEALSKRVAAQLVSSGFVPFIADPFSSKHDGRFRGAPGVYHFAVQHAPVLWATYFWMRQNTVLSRIERSLLTGRLRDALEALIERVLPSCIVVTAGVYCPALMSVRQAGGLGVPTIIWSTDLVGGSHIWFQPGADLYVVPSIERRTYAVHSGLDPERIRVTGFPLSMDFQDSHEPFDIQRPQILVTLGANSVGDVRGIVRSFHATQREVELTIPGRFDARVLADLATDQVHVRTPGFVDSILDLMHRSDAVVIKSGSLTCYEAVQAAKPVIISRASFGSEQSNAQLLVESGMAVRVTRTQNVATVALSFLSQGRQHTVVASRMSAAAHRLQEVLPPPADCVAIIEDALRSGTPSTQDATAAENEPEK